MISIFAEKFCHNLKQNVFKYTVGFLFIINYEKVYGIASILQKVLQSQAKYVFTFKSN